MVDSKHKPLSVHLRRIIPPLFLGLMLATALLALGASMGLYLFENRYSSKIYPHVKIGEVSVGGWTPQEVENFWQAKNLPLQEIQFTLITDTNIATISATELNLGYDAKLSATQAYLVGRSPHFLSNLYNKFFRNSVPLTPLIRWDEQILNDALNRLAQNIDIPPQNALFTYQNGRVTAFRPSAAGRKLDQKSAQEKFAIILPSVVASAQNFNITIPLTVKTIAPAITTDTVNSFGIREQIGRGYSEFAGSIPGRIHNVRLAAGKIHGILIPPGTTFSFNQMVGDISAATGYQSAYIIKDGRTVLGDGGGVCQVSTTLFRAALNSGLPIVERHAHAYRVHYYEEAGFKPGIDATVFAPSVDLKFKNDTPHHILVQTKTDTNKLTLTIDFYGTSDGRRSEIYNHTVTGIIPPPAPLYQDDPTLPPGVVKQVDWSAWGAKTNFQYKVTRDNQTLVSTNFASNYRPWQAVYLRGPIQ